MPPVTNAHVRGMTLWNTPANVKRLYPGGDHVHDRVQEQRAQMRAIMRGTDPRMLVVGGPCSIDGYHTAHAFGARLAPLAEAVSDKAFLVMRTCFDKPRTVSRPGVWPGFIMDPHKRSDGSHDFNYGICYARLIMVQLIERGVPIAMEIMDHDMVQYFDDLLTMVWIGARTAQVPNLRRFGSGISMPIGIKNTTEGNVHAAIDAVESVSYPNFFSGIDEDTGRKASFNAEGNPDGFVILRGSSTGPNYGEATVAATFAELEKRKLPPYLMVDCSHKNCEGDYRKQAKVFDEALRQRRAGARGIGAMLEWYLEEGRQDFPPEPHQARFGQSFTDACLSWDEGERLVRTI